MLRVENLDVFYGDVQALDGVSLDVGEGAIVAIVGANGAGKTTLIRALAGMQPQARGRIMFRGTDISRLAEPSGLRSRHRPGRGRAARCSRRFPSPKILTWARMLPRARAQRAKNRERVLAMFPMLGRARRGRRPARCPAASSRCSPSAAA